MIEEILEMVPRAVTEGTKFLFSSWGGSSASENLPEYESFLMSLLEPVAKKQRATLRKLLERSAAAIAHDGTVSVDDEDPATGSETAK